MIEVLVLLALVHGVYAGYKAFMKQKSKQAMAVTGTKPVQTGTPVASAEPALQAPPRLLVEGSTKPSSGNFSFLKLFGLGKAQLVDLCYIPGPISLSELAPKVANTLKKMHEDGDAVGTDVMEFLHHQKRLADSEFLWFALVGINRGKELGLGHRLVAFVDKKRNPSPPLKPAM